jgi:hypothetical protein
MDDQVEIQDDRALQDNWDLVLKKMIEEAKRWQMQANKSFDKRRCGIK